MVEAFLGLGGNVGDARRTLDEAIALLCGKSGIRLVARSSAYRTAPWGVEDQPAFINVCIVVETSLTPHQVLERAQAVESVLQGQSFESKLVAKTYAGLSIGPLSPRSESASPILARPAGMAWAVMQRVDHPDPVVANSQCLHDLANGANGLSLQLTGAI